jgi:cold shock CspA family protein
MDSQRGTVTTLKRDFGFIAADHGGDVFFHRSALRDVEFEQLEIGRRVEFVPDVTGKRGPRCWTVRAL